MIQWVDNMFEELKKLKTGKVINAKMKDYTTYKVGGSVLALVIPEDTNDLIKLMNYIYNNNIKYKILGNGSNLIFNESGFDGVIIKLDKFDKYEQNDNTFIVGSGYQLIRFSNKVSNLGYTGMEFATGIPGTIGGAVFMNAGAYNSDMGYVIDYIKVLTPQLEIKTLYNSELNFHYRTSYLKEHKNYICLEVCIKLKKGDKDVIADIIKDRRKRRLESQPLEYPSAGSVFRNPTNNYAGKLIEELGFKGYNYKGAEVSTKHANFIINKYKAKGEDIKELINMIKNKVKEKYDIDLIVEQEFVE